LFFKSQKQETSKKRAKRDTYKKRGVYSALFVLENRKTKRQIKHWSADLHLVDLMALYLPPFGAKTA
jgi:hypothetical protein